MILDKKQMTEEDIKLNYITPAINAAGWQNGVNITMETKITDGRINIKGNEDSLTNLNIETLKTICAKDGEYQMTWILSLLILNYELL